MKARMLLLAVAGIWTASVCACGPRSAQTDITPLSVYVAEARTRTAEEDIPEGSLWTSHGRRSDLYRDAKAFDLHDVVTIRVVESTSALASADAKSSRQSANDMAIGNLFGLEKHIGELSNLVSAKNSGSYEGKGSTARETTLRTTLTARVVNVLPNGYLVVEGAREVRVNNENQTIHLTGVVRPEDINRNNVVLSSAVAQMSVRLQGKGVVSQPLKPGWLYKILSGISPF